MLVYTGLGIFVVYSACWKLVEGISDVEYLGGFVWYGMLMTEDILEILPRSIVLEEDDSSENLELVE